MLDLVPLVDLDATIGALSQYRNELSKVLEQASAKVTSWHWATGSMLDFRPGGSELRISYDDYFWPYHHRRWLNDDEEPIGLDDPKRHGRDETGTVHIIENNWWTEKEKWGLPFQQTLILRADKFIDEVTWLGANRSPQTMKDCWLCRHILDARGNLLGHVKLDHLGSQACNVVLENGRPHTVDVAQWQLVQNKLDTLRYRRVYALEFGDDGKLDRVRTTFPNFPLVFERPESSDPKSLQAELASTLVRAIVEAIRQHPVPRLKLALLCYCREDFGLHTGFPGFLLLLPEQIWLSGDNPKIDVRWPDELRVMREAVEIAEDFPDDVRLAAWRLENLCHNVPELESSLVSIMLKPLFQAAVELNKREVASSLSPLADFAFAVVDNTAEDDNVANLRRSTMGSGIAWLDDAEDET